MSFADDRAAAARVDFAGIPLEDVTDAVFDLVTPRAVDTFQRIEKSVLLVTFSTPVAFLKAMTVGSLTFGARTCPLVAVESPVLTIFVKDLPRWISRDSLTSALSRYGDVLDHHFETYKEGRLQGIKNGNRRLRLKAKSMVPNILHVAGYKVQITYSGVERLCFHCRTAGHVAKLCPKRTKKNVPGPAILEAAPVMVQPGSNLPDDGVTVIDSPVVDLPIPVPDLPVVRSTRSSPEKKKKNLPVSDLPVVSSDDSSDDSSWGEALSDEGDVMSTDDAPLVDGPVDVPRKRKRTRRGKRSFSAVSDVVPVLGGATSTSPTFAETVKSTHSLPGLRNIWNSAHQQAKPVKPDLTILVKKPKNVN